MGTAQARCGFREMAHLFVAQKISYRLLDADACGGRWRPLPKGISVGFKQSCLALGCLPASGFGGDADKFSRWKRSVDPLGAATATIVFVGVRTGRVMSCVDVKHSASESGGCGRFQRRN